jgi:hypothetical protein
MGRYEGNNGPHLRPSDYDNYGDVLPDGYKRIDGIIVASNWRRHIVDNGFNADWICKDCGYVVKTDYPPMECPKCMRGDEK